MFAPSIYTNMEPVLNKIEKATLSHVANSARERRLRHTRRRKDMDEILKLSLKDTSEKMIQTVGQQLDEAKYVKTGLSQGVLLVALLVSSASHFLTLQYYSYNDDSYYTYLMLMSLSIVLQVISLVMYTFIHLKEDYNYDIAVSVEVLNVLITKLTIIVILIHLFVSL